LCDKNETSKPNLSGSMKGKPSWNQKVTLTGIQFVFSNYVIAGNWVPINKTKLQSLMLVE